MAELRKVFGGIPDCILLVEDSTSENTLNRVKGNRRFQRNLSDFRTLQFTLLMELGCFEREGYRRLPPHTPTFTKLQSFDARYYNTRRSGCNREPGRKIILVNQGRNAISAVHQENPPPGRVFIGGVHISLIVTVPLLCLRD